MPQTWDKQGNLVQPGQQGMPPIMPGSAAANPNAPAVMPPPSAPTAKPKQTWDKTGKPVQPAQAKPMPPAEPAKPEGAISKFFGAGPAIPAKPLNPTEKKSPFQSGVVSGAMLDPTKISQQPTFTGQVKEVGSQMYEGSKNWLLSVGKDPLHVGDPVDAMVKGQTDAYRKVRDGLKAHDHDMLMNGLGEAVGNLSVIVGGAKSAKEGFGVTSAARDASFAAKDITAKRAIVSAASHAALDTLKDEHSTAIEVATKAERARIGGAVAALNMKDVAADPKGYVPQKLALATLDQAVSDKKATVLMSKRMMPSVAKVRSLLEGHTQNMTFNDVKQVRSVVGGMLVKADGVERAVLGDYYSSLTKNLKGRAAHLGGLAEWDDYNNSTEKLTGHEEGLIPELTNSKTGLEYAKKIASEQNQGRLSTLEADLKLPKGFFADAVKNYKPITNFAKMTEGDSIVARTANRLVALKSHPITASLGGVAGVTAGRAIGTAFGSPMAGSFIGLTLGAALAHDLMSKAEAAKAIREIGGPSGVMGIRPVPGQNPPPSGTPSSSMTVPQSGPGGGGSPSPSQPPGSLPPVPPPIITPDTSGLSPNLAKLLPEAKSVSEKTPSMGDIEKQLTKIEEGQNRTIERLSGKKGTDIKPITIDQDKLADALNERGMTRTAAAARAEEIMNVLKEPSKHSIFDVEHAQRVNDAAMKIKEKAKAAPEVTKVPEGQHAVEPSKRKGMVKDTPEARKAKSAERIAARRASGQLGSSTSGGDVVGKAEAAGLGSLEDQARRIAGKFDFKGKTNVELEQGLQTLYGENGKRFLKQFQQLAKQQKWPDEVYRGYLEETITKRAEELAKRPNVPGLHTEPKVE